MRNTNLLIYIAVVFRWNTRLVTDTSESAKRCSFVTHSQVSKVPLTCVAQTSSIVLTDTEHQTIECKLMKTGERSDDYDEGNLQNE